MSSENYYSILGVTENAGMEEIKKAYKSLAIKHHPDKGGSEETFKKISEAYNVIGDENKRKEYDNQRNNPFSMGGGGPFEDFFNGMFSTNRKRTAPDKVIGIDVGTIESFLSKEKQITYQRNIMCNTCNGSGGSKIVCKNCNGEGFKTIRVGNGLFNQIVRQGCTSCEGNGFTYSSRCGKCQGTTTIKDINNLLIKLPHGIDNGQFLKIQNKGDYINGVYGNLVLKINLVEEDKFEKMNNDLIFNAIISYEDLLNETITVPHPSGQMSVKIPTIFDTTKPLRVKGKGFQTTEFGDLYVKLNVKFNKTHLKNDNISEKIQ
jgi:molecular chaperone DnaJ